MSSDRYLEDVDRCNAGIEHAKVMADLLLWAAGNTSTEAQTQLNSGLIEEAADGIAWLLRDARDALHRMEEKRKAQCKGG